MRAIYRTKRGDLVSKVPWLVYAATSAGNAHYLIAKIVMTVQPYRSFSVRIITVMIETGDALLLAQYSISVFLNLCVILVACKYTPEVTPPPISVPPPQKVKKQ